jgi:hypothetical protein
VSALVVSSSPHTASPVLGGAACPLREGAPTLDTLLAALGGDSEAGAALDLALELRYAFHVTRDAGTCAALAQQLGGALGESHYLAFYRVRLWLGRALVVEIRAHRGDTWTRFPLSPVCNGPESLECACLRQWAREAPGRCAALAQVRHMFADAVRPTAGDFFSTTTDARNRSVESAPAPHPSHG